MEAYIVHLIILACIYIMMTCAFNLTVGHTGLLNLGHIALMGVGAYTSAILSRTFGVPVPLAIIAAVALTGIVAGILAIPARKIKGDYYALVTLGFMFVANAVFINWSSLTRGTLGIPGIPRPEMFATNNEFLVLAVVTAFLVVFALDRLVASPFGQALEAVRDDDEVAESLGKPVFKLRFLSLVISGMVIGLCGAYLAHYIQFIAPGSFWLDSLVWVLAGMMLGGMASMRGAVLGTVLLFLISEPLRFVTISPTLIGPLRLMIFMAILILIVIFRPKGIMGRAQLEN